MGAMSLVKTHRALLCAVIKIIRHFGNFLEIYSHSVFYNRTAQNSLHSSIVGSFLHAI